MGNEVTQKHLEGIKTGVVIFAPLCLYELLNHRELYKKDPQLIKVNLFDNITGLPLSKWPNEIKDDFYRLCDALSVAQLKKVFAEIHYFLIFNVFNYSSKHFVPPEKRKDLLDILFTTFNDASKLFANEYPEMDAFNKYNQSDNPYLLFAKEISEALNEEDSMILYILSLGISNNLKYLIFPGIDKIFSTLESSR